MTGGKISAFNCGQFGSCKLNMFKTKHHSVTMVSPHGSVESADYHRNSQTKQIHAMTEIKTDIVQICIDVVIRYGKRC